MNSPSTGPDFTVAGREVIVPVSVVLECTMDEGKKWRLPHWNAYAVITGRHAGHSAQEVKIHDDGITRRYLWGGMVVHLYKDGNEGYWYNLLSGQPHLFIVCEGEQGERRVEPAFITANQDEATGYMEVDRLVLSVPMPEDMRAIVEHYVISHYVPEEKKKRRRKDWRRETQANGTPIEPA